MEEEKITRRTFLRNCAIAAGLSAVTSYGLIVASNLLEVKQVDINTGKLSKPLKLLQFSDTHIYQHLPADLLKATIDTIKSFEVDFICFTGDAITYGSNYLDSVEKCFSMFSAKGGKFAALGNHDHKDGEHSKAVHRTLTKAGYDVMVNSFTEVEYKGEKIIFAGLKDLWSGPQDLKGVLGNLNKDSLIILLSHNPSNIEEISKYNPDITLSGHTHGGQIYIPYLLNGIYKNLYDPRFIGGYYKVNNTHLYVNRGIGSTLTMMKVFGKHYKIPPIRLFARPEVTIFNIS